MLISKLYEFESAHIVRDCSSTRCSTSLHGHSYKVEVQLTSDGLDNAFMVYDFGLLKPIKTFIDSFDHGICLKSDDDINYINDMKKHSARWIELPCNPSAEGFCVIFFICIDKILKNTKMINSEKGVRLHSVKVNETRTGYAQCFYDDAFLNHKAIFDINDIVFSEQVEFENGGFLKKLKTNEIFINPKKI